MGYTKEQLVELKTRLKKAGISNGQLARYAGYWVTQVSAVLNGHTTITRVIEAAEELADNPELVELTPDRSHPLKRQLEEAGLSQMDLVRATGRKKGLINTMLQGTRAVPKAVQETGARLVKLAKTEGVEVAKAKARKGEV